MEDGEVIQHLQRRGLVSPKVQVKVNMLKGGVSGEVWVAAAAGLDLVVKRARPELMVETEWLADEERTITEGWALRLASDINPGTVPRVIDLDPRMRILVIQRAPRSWRNWRTNLLQGEVDPEVGGRLGALLRVWHKETSTPSRLRSMFQDVTLLNQLRIEPFHRAIATRHPELATEIEAVIDLLLTRRTCLVHGDFSPKNILVGDSRLWVLDWEVAHVGDPTFDLAYMLCHLTLKTVHCPGDASRYRLTARAFLAAYGTEPRKDLAANVACLLLGRVDGKSPADYLTEPERETVRALGKSMLVDPDTLGDYV